MNTATKIKLGVLGAGWAGGLGVSPIGAGLLATAFASSACGGGGTGAGITTTAATTTGAGGSTETTGGATMTTTGSGGPPPGIVGPWEVIDIGLNLAFFLTLDGDDSYSYAVARPGAGVILDAQVETGTYAVSGSAMTFAPVEFTCRTPDPVRHDMFSLGHAALAVIDPSMMIVYTPRPDAGAPPVFVDGCFAKDGGFTQSSLAPVVAADAGSDGG